MSIKVSLMDDGNIQINSSNEKDFVMSKHGIDIAMSFIISYRDNEILILDPGNSIGESLFYIIKELKSQGFEIELDEYLNNYLKSFSNEKELIKNTLEEDKICKEYHLKNPNFLRKLYSYQKIGINHALTVRNAANFSVPGSGKTSVALGVFAELKHIDEIKRTLIIGPASSFEPWEFEFKECFGRKPKSIRWSGSVSKRQKLIYDLRNTELILCTYQTACNDAILLEKLLRDAPTLMILDESHYIKNPDGVRSNILLRLAPFAKRRMILTGTPAPYSLADIWSQFTFLWPSYGLLGTRYEFDTMSMTDNTTENFSKHIKNFFYRTKKSDLGLPEPKLHIIKVKNESIPAEQKKLIEILEEQTYRKAKEHISKEEDVNTLLTWRAARIIRLIQASSNPGMLLNSIKEYYGEIPENLDIDFASLRDMAAVFKSRKILPAKVEVAITKAKELIESGKKVIIWTWFIENIDLLSQLLSEYNPLLLYGGIKPYEDEEDTDNDNSREKNIREFKTRKDRPLIIANPAACAESISLHKYCHEAIYLDRNFNCGQFLQSMDRIHRIGLPSDVTTNYYIIVMDCSIERVINKRLQSRQSVLYKLMDDDMPVMGIDDEMWVAENSNELDLAYDDLLQDLRKKYSD
jgi:SNF2 family DNA or RNA helicase